MADVNILQMAYEFLKNLELKNIKLEINSLGCEESRTNFKTALKNILKNIKMIYQRIVK